MNGSFNESSFEDSLRVLNVVSNNSQYTQKNYFLIAFGYWYGNKGKLSQLSKSYDIQILDNKQPFFAVPNTLLNKMVNFFLAGNHFTLLIKNHSDIVPLYQDLMNFLNIHFYFLDKHKQSFLINHIKKVKFDIERLDDYLSKNETDYLIIRLDSNANCETGFTKEICYDKKPNFLNPFI